MFSKPANIRDDISRRSWVVGIGILALAVAIAWRIIYVQQVGNLKGVRWIKLLSKTVKIDTIQAMRGNIYSSDGSLLATSLPYYTMSLDPMKADSNYFFSVAKTPNSSTTRLDSLSRLMAKHFGKGQRTADEYRRLILFARKKKDRDVRLVNRPLTLREANLVKTWPFFRTFKSGGTQGGKLKVFYRRYKPFGSLAERTIGNLDPQTFRGMVGLEASFNQKLAGKNGMGRVAFLDDGTRMPMDEAAKIQPESGMDLQTTLDVNFQDIAETALKKTLRAYRADYGCVIVMEVGTGEIKAMVNLAKGRDSSYSDNYNYAIARRANPGSTFKLATVMAALETGRVSPSTIHQTGNGTIQYKGVNINDGEHAYGPLTTQEVMEKSSNVGIQRVMEKAGFYGNVNQYLSYMEKFRLMEPTGIHMAGEARNVSRMPTEPNPRRVSVCYASRGYEWEYTPLQMLSLYNAVANDGYWVRPMIVKEIRDAERVVQEMQPYVSPQRICSERTLRQVRTMLEGVVERGTAKKLKDVQYKIAGKTGTAQMFHNGKYMEGKYNVSFAGYFPAHAPKYSCIVLVNYPKGASVNELFAASVAAPVFKEVSDRIVGYDVNMHPPFPATKNKASQLSKHLKSGQSDDLRAIAGEMNLEGTPRLEGWVETQKGANGNWVQSSSSMPSLKGMSLRDALYLIENYGYRVQFKGAGKVVDYQREGNLYRLTLQ